MEHKCTANGDDHRLEIANDGKWYLNRHWAISFCPYCGEKLEPPDEKIEVSRKVLRGIWEELREARRMMWGRPSEASVEIYKIMDKITVILND